MKPPSQRRWQAWWPFAALCAASATRWMLAEAYPRSVSTAASECVGCATVALLSLALVRAKAPRPTFAAWARRFSVRSVSAGAMLLGGPVIGLFFASHAPGANALVIALALVPVIAAVAQNAFDSETSATFAGRVWPGLAAAAGLLLLLPQPSLADPWTDAALLLAPLLTGTGAAMFTAQRSHLSSFGPRFSAAMSGAALLFGVAWLLQLVLHRYAGLFGLAALLDALFAALTVLTLERLGCTRWTAQFALVPLLVVLEGLVLLRPPLDARTVAAVALLLIASVFLLLPQAPETES